MFCDAADDAQTAAAKGVTLMHPSWSGSQTGLSPFPIERM